jgi:hypothetical protein
VTTGGAKPAQAADGQPLIIGQLNTGNGPTTLTMGGGALHGFVVNSGGDPNDPGFPALVPSTIFGDAAFGAGVQGRSLTGAGLVGQAGGTDPNSPPDDLYAGVFGVGVDAVGVGGRSLINSGVFGHTGGPDPNAPLAIAGVFGSAGVPGDPNNPGDIAGIFGYASDPNSPAVLARNSMIEGLALDVQGRALFSSAGTGTIPVKTDRVTVAHSAVTASSIVLVTLASDPIGGRRLKFVEATDGMFTVVLSGKAKVPVNFGYLVVN